MNPLMGVIYHWLGGLASGSFYVPYRFVRNWSWEVYWIVGGFFSWMCCPTLMALLLTEKLPEVLRQQSESTLFWTFFFGALWGIGGITFGLTMRYLGMSLGMGVSLGLCAVFGTLMPPLIKLWIPPIPVSENLLQVASSFSGKVTLFGVFLCFIGILMAAYAGLLKEREAPVHREKTSVAEFHFFKGLTYALISGLMSACFSFALTAGHSIGESSLALGTLPLWAGLPKLVVILLGGFMTNCLWCLILQIKNGSTYQLFADRIRSDHFSQQVGQSDVKLSLKIPRLQNWILCLFAGVIWYFQFFFYTMGESNMGRYGFASWSLHMAGIIIFSTFWGVVFKEWRGSGRTVMRWLSAGMLLLVVSTAIIGYGTFLKTTTP